MQNILLWIEYGLIVGGIILLAKALAPVRAIIQLLPEGNVRTRWKVLAALIFMFITGYILYVFFHFPAHIISLSDIVVPGIFLGGAIFVCMVCSFSLKTALDLQQICILEQEIITDPLMNIYNRRYLDRRLMEEVQRASRYELPFSVFLLDIDHFKKVNDTYGHQVGDLVLKKIGSVIVNSVRELDVVIRYGGEEVLVILPSTKVADAVELAERLRRKIEETMMVEPDLEKIRPAIRVTVSIGVAGYRFCGDQDTVDTIVGRADKALYQAKSEGRNRVVSSNGSDSLNGNIMTKK
ncbi:MAG: GGDEF domain-containing protein [Desulfobulbaceae bacterium]